MMLISRARKGLPVFFIKDIVCLLTRLCRVAALAIANKPGRRLCRYNSSLGNSGTSDPGLRLSA